jgi:hypothetical protein
MDTNLIDRYVKEVGRHLPPKSRGDVETELHSLLGDSLHGRIAGKEPLDPAALEAEQVAVLKAFGPPAIAAARYAPSQRFLIGPNLYDPYCIALFGAGIGITVLVLLLAGLSLLDGAADILPELLDFAGVYFQWMVMSFGVITLVFAIVERLLPEETVTEAKEQAWDPRTLPEIHNPARIERGSLISEIVCLGFALMVFNLFPNWVGLNFLGSVNGESTRWYSIPLLSADFYRYYLPLWNINFLLTVLLNLFLLRRGQWDRLTRVIDFGLALFGLILLAAMLAGPPLMDIQGVVPESLKALLASILPGFCTPILAVVLIIMGVDALKKIVAIFRPDPIPWKPGGVAEN